MESANEVRAAPQATRLILLITSAAIIFAILQRLLSKSSHDSREPPVLRPRVPIIGHMFGLAYHGASYFSTVSKRCPHPIFSLPMGPSQTYVVTSPALASQVQRGSKALSFNKLIVEITGRMVSFNSASMSILRGSDRTQSESPFMQGVHEIIYAALTPAEIKDMSLDVLAQLTQRLNKVTDGEEGDLFLWVRKQFTVATTHALYGPENPLALDPSLEVPFWEFEAGIISLIVGIFPSITARKAYVGRERMVEALIEYVQQERYKQASKLIQGRARFHLENGLSIPEYARSEVGMLFGGLVNAGVTTFWILNNIFSRPDLLAELRAEIDANALTTSSGLDGDHTRAITYSQLKASCPLLNSVYRESLRLAAPMSGSRLVVADTIVGDQYLLRAGNVVQIAGGVMHYDESIWGSDAASFNARRFVGSVHGVRSEGEGEKQVHPAAFRAFGGGSVYCPGRHFAHVEIMSMVAGVVCAFDMDPPKGKEAIQFDPPMDVERMPLGVVKPLEEVRVRMRRRTGWEGVGRRFSCNS
ncbi:cytochrome P450 [Mytilinidion resinicola]|uniref:Cytochrome P450 n=1 Tax=Mytilinidion resinicola TaxID=574789 RepID=A0A6A6Z5Q8_9PEZI|nr:cytochrome P450 [Mytilinidion resinicola]KAF2816431.1 cytochrome P450 [Mytilinidion resinicola]